MGTVLDPGVAYTISPAQLDDQLALMARSGVESVRTNLFWSGTQTSPTTFNWTAADTLVLAVARHHLSLLPVVEQTPAWASSRPSSPVYFNFPPTSPRLFGNFMTALIERYGPHGTIWKLAPRLRRYAVRYWQIWNEPAGNFDWLGVPYAATYVAMLRSGYKAVHRADPGGHVVLGAVTALNSTNRLPWTEMSAFYKAGARHFFDIASVNAYTYSQSVLPSVLRSLAIVTRVRAVMRSHGDARKRLWVTELTWPASQGKVPPKDLVGFETTAAGQAARLSAYYRYLAAHRAHFGISRAFWYAWATSYSASQTIGLTPTFAFSGLVRFGPTNGSFHPLPVLLAYARAAARLEGCRKSSVADRCR